MRIHTYIHTYIPVRTCTYLSGPASDGFAEVFIAPKIATGAEAPTSASATLRSPRGPVSVSWTMDASESALSSLHATIAVGVKQAYVTTPTTDEKVVSTTLVVRESGHVVWEKGKFVSGQPGVVAGAVAADATGVTFTVQSGVYNFTTTMADANMVVR